MKVDNDLVRHIAQLANLPLTDKEVEIFRPQLEQILCYVDKLAKVDTAGVEPTFQVLDNTCNIWREDKVSGHCLTQKEALSQAATTHQGYFVADNVFGGKKVRLPKKITRPILDKYNSVLTKVDPQGNLGHKDLFCTKGIETTAGAKVLNGYLPQYSATVVEQLARIGYKLKFKLNQDAWGHGSSGENSDFGPTKNPWDLSRVAGGSSSGSAVAVATCEVEIATGTDTCGSIRMPANFCNICGLKPTYGALSRYGVIAFASSLDCPSLFARSVTKLKEVFNKIAVSDSHDATSQSQARNKAVKKIKTIGLVKEFVNNKLILAGAKLLETQGVKLRNVSLPHANYGIAAYYLIAPTETCSNLALYDGVRFGHDRSNFGPEAKRRIMLGSFAASAGYAAKYYAKAAKIRSLIINDFAKVFQDVDAVLAPVSPTPAFKLGKNMADPLAMYLEDIYAAPASLAGLPSLALPCGFTQNKLPVGMQLIWPRWIENGLFQLGEQFQKITNYHLQRPIL